MKTTVELPDDLLIAAKKRAAELQVPLRQLLEDGLRRQLESPRKKPKAGRKKFRWVLAKGGLPPGLDMANRSSMCEWLRKQS